ncbi:MAG TPA: hypothetical protein VFV49_11295 [Thermoanaerobaculia bacterium]|nr:hypothetical protein [Thermoanaerobaculia bacterium]
MPYKVQFVGLICFFRENGNRVALLPDATQAAPVHIGRIVVDPNSVIEAETTWPVRPKIQRQLGEFRLPRCSVSMSGADQAGALVTMNHESRLHGLQAINQAFAIDTTFANTIATVPIRQGTLEAFRYPRTPNHPDSSVISQLDLDHSDKITITVTPRDGSEVRTIVLQPNTEVAIANDIPGDHAPHDHFHIYELLDSHIPHPPLGETPPTQTDPEIPLSPSLHRIFDGIIDNDLLCPNTGCCP